MSTSLRFNDEKVYWLDCQRCPELVQYDLLKICTLIDIVDIEILNHCNQVLGSCSFRVLEILEHAKSR